ncbi:branched-chain amino acid ABC transporter permease [Haloarchaeobius sp. HRN-SO-5]|uniref:branched-chain amino acid ABC transporter permease n=1 Tax=Haloarchaeobius sp. HRN-SO-5 TaxID=3446118 RepID=UPI003EBE3780
MVEITTLLKTTLFGLQLGMTLVLITVGLTLIFGMMDVINIAHGSLYMLGAYFGLGVVGATGNFWLALLLAPLLVGVVGAVMEVFAIRPLYGRDPLYHILLTFGIALIIQGTVEGTWGAEIQNITKPALMQGTYTIGPILYPKFRIFITVVSTLLVVAIWVLFTRSNWGILMRASGYDSEMVDALGIDVAKVFTGVFIFGAVLAGLAGVLLGTARAASPSMGVNIIIQAFAIVVIGGLGSFRGAVVGAIAVGMINAFGALYASTMVELLVFLLMAVVLLVKPNGLFGEEAEVA